MGARDQLFYKHVLYVVQLLYVRTVRDDDDGWTALFRPEMAPGTVELHPPEGTREQGVYMLVLRDYLERSVFALPRDLRRYGLRFSPEAQSTIFSEVGGYDTANELVDAVCAHRQARALTYSQAL